MHSMHESSTRLDPRSDPRSCRDTLRLTVPFSLRAPLATLLTRSHACPSGRRASTTGMALATASARR
jgi:hypothetical protein